MMSRPLPKGWNWIPLGQYVENHDGRRVPISRSERESRQGAFPYYGASGVIDTIDGFTHDGEFVLIGEDGANLLTRSKPLAFLTRGKVWVNNHAHVLRCKPDFSNAYLVYYINSINLSAYVTGSAQPKLSQSMMNKIPIPVAPPEQQIEIVAELEKQFSRLDEAVANLQRVKANLKRYKASVLKAAVEGHLVETEAALARREGRTYETGEQLLQRILEERRAKWAGKGKYKEPDLPVLDGLNPLPEGWAYATTEQMCEQIASGSTPSPEAMFSGDGEVPFLKVYNLTFDGSLDFTVKPTFVSNSTHQGMLARSRSVPGDVLMNIVGPPLGKVSIVPPAYPEWNINQAIVTFRTSSGLVNQLLAHWLLARPVLSRLERTAKATAGQYNLQVSTCRKLPTPVPPLAEQKRIVAEVDRHLSIVREVEAEVDTNLKRAQALRQATLATAFAPNKTKGTTP
ncbi:MAG: restriction endonuclease subunit S [Rhodoferax sp.]|nr:restriction endonuclease subunit S [Rhodoferax sp.]